MARALIKKVVQIAAATLFLASISAAGDEVYKWVDKDGRVSFGDRPDNQTAEPVKIPRTPPPSREVELQRLRTKRTLDSYAAERAERTEKRVLPLVRSNTAWNMQLICSIATTLETSESLMEPSTTPQ
jgi:Domain of unknown function (DUF4124)